MDDRGKRIDVNVSSLVDLKAELLKKQEEFRRQKLENSSGTLRAKTSIKKPTVWSKKNVGVLERAQHDVEEKKAETDVLSRVKSSLEAKSEIYNKMALGGALADEESSKNFLVDFEQKSIDVLTAKKRADNVKAAAEEDRKRREDEEERRLLSEKIEESDLPDDQWVDYVDSFGRTRRCLKKDLPQFKDFNKKQPVTRIEGGNSRELLSADMKRELQRQEWEKQEEDALNNPVGPTHYADVRFNENREHGVGYFEFAKDEETRKQQMETLKKLRKQTEEQQLKTDRLKEKRKALMQARLAKVKQRKTVQDLPDLDLDPLADEDKVSSDRTPKLEDTELTLSGPELTSRTESLTHKVTPVREWDRGKRFDETSWLTERRDERQSEFAPPQIYSQSTNSSKKEHSQPRVQHKGGLSSKTKIWSASSSTATFESTTIFENLPRQSETHVGVLDQLETLPNEPCQLQTTDSMRSKSLERDISMKLSAIRNNLVAPSDSASVGDVSVTLQSKKLAPDGTSMMTNHYSPYPLYETAQVSEDAEEWNGNVSWPNVYAPGSETSPHGIPYSTDEPMRVADNMDIGVTTSRWADKATVLDTVAFDAELKFASLQQEYSSHPTAPQPAHYASAPSLPQPKQPKYERVFLHDLPPTLPAPPTAGSTVALQYPSQEEIIGPRRKQERQAIDEQAAIKNWYRQFDRNWRASKAPSLPLQKDERSEGHLTTKEEPNVVLKPRNIPFASPYIQIKNTDSDVAIDAEAVKYDPSRPPPPSC